MEVGKSVRRVDAFDKATGRAKYCDDLCDRSALVARVLHSTIANGVVKSIDTSAAEQIEGVVKIVTCFDVPQIKFPTAGHPWSTDPHHQDVADRLLLTSRVCFYGDDIAAVVAENEVAAAQALRALRVEYEEYPFVLDVQEAMKPDAPLLHEEFPNNILAHTTIRNGNYEEASREPGLIKVEGWYDTPTVQHCHIENHMCFASMEAGRIVIYSSTQIPHIVRRVVGQQPLHQLALRYHQPHSRHVAVLLPDHRGGAAPRGAARRTARTADHRVGALPHGHLADA